jgi:ABC-type Co2+ transport system permease subunit
VHHAQGTRHVGPTSATLDEAFSALFGASVGVAVGSALCALSVRRGSRLASGLLAGLAAYVVVLAPAFISTDDVKLGEDLSPGGLASFAFLLLPFAVFALLGASVGRFIASLAQRARTRKRDQQ